MAMNDYLPKSLAPRTSRGWLPAGLNPDFGSYRAGPDVMTGVGLFALGALVGASLGLLFAPKSGHELRSDLGRARGMLPGSNREPDLRMNPEYGTQTSPHPR